MDSDGEALEIWAEQNELKLIHKPKLPTSFNSGRSRRGYNPNNLFISDPLAQQSVKYVENPLFIPQNGAGNYFSIEATVKPETAPFERSFNRDQAKTRK